MSVFVGDAAFGYWAAFSFYLSVFMVVGCESAVLPSPNPPPPPLQGQIDRNNPKSFLAPKSVPAKVPKRR